MISRGHYIGFIIDEFATIAEKISMRNRLGLFDLTVHAETYFCNVLNIICGWKLISLNADRSNEPGLDLGDAAARVGIQVTSTATSQKVKDTLGALTPEQKDLYTSKIVVLIVGKKQGSYTIEQELVGSLPFSKKNIWDLNTLARKALHLDIEDLQRLHTYINQEAVRVRVELEVPDNKGVFPTNAYDKWERQAKPKVGDGKAFIQFVAESKGEPLDVGDVKDLKAAIASMANQLKRLPRVTREFLVVLIERREPGSSRRWRDWVGSWNLLEKLRREYQGRDSDLKAELELLEHAEFASVNYDDPQEHGAPEVFVNVSKNDNLAGFFLDFIDEQKLDLRQVIGRVDLSEF